MSDQLAEKNGSKLHAAKFIIALSGKRKSGKDFVAGQLVDILGVDRCVIITLAKPIKSHFANLYGMNLNELLTPSEYKEKRREEMVLWGEEQRKQNPYVFCEAITKEARDSNKPVWIVSDIRRHTDIDYFRKYAVDHNISAKFIRVNCDISTRVERGWKFTKGIDDADTECQLDTFSNWDVVLENSSNDDLNMQVKQLCHVLQTGLSITPN